MQRRARAFQPEDIAAMQSAFDESCEALRFAIETRDSADQAGELREEIAKRVVEVAGAGERQPATITQKVLADMPPLKANW